MISTFESTIVPGTSAGYVLRRAEFDLLRERVWGYHDRQRASIH